MDNKKYISFNTAEEVSEKLGAEYLYKFHHKTKKCWRYEETSNGAHPSGPKIDDWDGDDPFDYYPEVWFAFSWEELYALMNAVVIGDYRKTEFECIEDIDTFALELYYYAKEKMEREIKAALK